MNNTVFVTKALYNPLNLGQIDQQELQMLHIAYTHIQIR